MGVANFLHPNEFKCSGLEPSQDKGRKNKTLSSNFIYETIPKHVFLNSYKYKPIINNFIIFLFSLYKQIIHKRMVQINFIHVDN